MFCGYTECVWSEGQHFQHLLSYWRVFVTLSKGSLPLISTLLYATATDCCSCRGAAGECWLSACVAAVSWSSSRWFTLHFKKCKEISFYTCKPVQCNMYLLTSTISTTFISGINEHLFPLLSQFKSCSKVQL
jgi:hypothetical protein